MKNSLFFTLNSIALMACIIGSNTAFASSGRLEITEDYELEENHYGYVIIKGHDLTFDCNHKTIDASDYGSGIIIESRENITVKNCDIVNYSSIGIDIDGSYYVTVKNCNLNGNSDGEGAAGSGIYMYWSGYINFDDVQVAGNNWGFKAAYTNKVECDYCYAIWNIYDGFIFEVTDWVDFNRVWAIGNGDDGIYVHGADHIDIRRAVVDNNDKYGMWLRYVNDGSVSYSEGHNNGSYDLYVYRSTDMTYLDNDFGRRRF